MIDILTKACQEGEVGTVKLILNMDVDLTGMRYPKTNLTPLHFASIEGNESVVDLLLDKKFSPSLEDQYSNTALHLAAKHGHLGTVIRILAHESRCNSEASESLHTKLLYQVNKDSLTPLGCALEAKPPKYDVAKYCLSLAKGNPVDSFPEFGKAYLSSYVPSCLDKPVKIFVLGDNGVGKSTLTKALQESRSVLSKITFGLAASGRRIRSSEDKHFSGVITTDFYSPSSKRVMFYDLAGHTNYFDQDLVESPADIQQSIFIVIVSLKMGYTKVQERLVFWLNFLYHHLCSLPGSEESKPTVVVIGSHRDSRTFRRISDTERLFKAFDEIQKQHQCLMSSFSFLTKPFSLDCRKFQTADMCHLRDSLYKACLKLVPTLPLPPSACYVLSSILSSKDFADLPALTVGKLASIISSKSSNDEAASLYHLLPVEVSRLLDICKELAARQRIFLFRNPNSSENDSSSDMWLVQDSHLILTAIDKQLAALSSVATGLSDANLGPDFFVDSKEKLLYSFGILARTTLSRALRGVLSTENSDFELDADLAIQLLQHFKYTEQIESMEPQDQVFFLPGLLDQKDIGEPDIWEESGFKFALSVKAVENEENVITYLLPRFLKNLLLCLIRKFILPEGSSDESSGQATEFDTAAVWSRGVSWLANGIRTHLVANDDAIILNMSSEAGTEMSCTILRNEIIRTINEERLKWQESIETDIFVLPLKEKMLPVESFKSYHKHWIPLKKVHYSLLEKDSYHQDNNLLSCFFFEPAISLLEMPFETVQYLSDPQNSNAMLEPKVLSDIYDSFGGAKEAIIDYLRLPAVEGEATASVPSSSPAAGAEPNDVDDDSSGSTTTSSHHGTSGSQSSNHSSAQQDTRQRKIVCGEFLSILGSLSIFDFMVFLKDVQVCVKYS